MTKKKKKKPFSSQKLKVTKSHLKLMMKSQSKDEKHFKWNVLRTEINLCLMYFAAAGHIGVLSVPAAEQTVAGWMKITDGWWGKRREGSQLWCNREETWKVLRFDAKARNSVHVARTQSWCPARDADISIFGLKLACKCTSPVFLFEIWS